MPDRWKIRDLPPDEITANDFLLDGKGFLSAAKREQSYANDDPGSHLKVFYYLLLHSIELSLKGILRLNGISRSKLKEGFGHDLCKLRDQAVRSESVSFDDDESAFIQELNVPYKKKGLEYTSFKSVPVPADVTSVMNLADRLQESLKDLIDADSK